METLSTFMGLPPARDGAARELLAGLLAVQLGLVSELELLHGAEAWARGLRSGRLVDHLPLDTTGLEEVARAVARLDRGCDGPRGACATVGPPGLAGRLAGACGYPPDVARALAQTAESICCGSTATHDTEIGRGGIGRVLIHFDPKIGREVALKELLDTCTDPTAEARFIREARVTGQLEHPGIVPVYELGRMPQGRPYYTMKLVRGRTLREAMESCAGGEGRLRLLGHFLGVCQAIAHAHSHGVIHRDLKPSNVMVGEFGETVVLDWGLAKVRGAEDPRGAELSQPLEQREHAAETVAGSALGTPAYMSPEQAAGRLEDIDERSDVWGLGAILYELLVGRAPFEGTDIAAVLTQVREGRVAPVRSRNAHAPAELAAIAERALQVDPSRRYSTVRELIADVEAFQQGARVTAHRYTALDHAGRFVKRHRLTLFVAGATSVALLAAGLLGIYREYLLAERERARAEHSAFQARQRSAQMAFDHGDLFEARASLRSALELEDSPSARSLWGKLEADPRLWSVELGGPLFGAVMLADGSRIAVASSDRMVYLVDADTRAVRILRGHTRPVALVAAAPDGRWLASASADGELAVWEVATGQLRLVRFEGEYVDRLRFTRDGRLAALGSRFRVWPAGGALGEPLVLENRLGGVGSMMMGGGSKLDIDPGGELLALGDGQQVALLELPSGRERKRLVGHSGLVWGVAFSPDGRWLASRSLDGTMRLWDLASAGAARVVDDPDPGSGIFFSADGRYILMGSSRGDIPIWDAQTGQVHRIARKGDELIGGGFSPDGKRIFYTDPYERRLTLRRQEPSLSAAVPCGSGAVRSVAVTPDGALVASAGLDGVRLWDVATGRRVRMLAGHADAVTTVAFSPDGKLLASGADDQTVSIWDVATGAQRAVLKGHEGTVWSVAFSPDGRLLASGGSDRTIRLWNVERASRVRVMENDGIVLALAFSPDGKTLACTDSSIRLWDVASGKRKQELKWERPSLALSESRDGRLLAASYLKDHQGQVVVWDLKSGASRLVATQGNYVTWLGFHPDGKRLGIPSTGGLARILDLEGGSVVDLLGHGSDFDVNYLRISDDGRIVVTGSDDGTVRVWDPDTGKPLWRAAALLMDPPRLSTQGGWLKLDAEGEQPAPSRTAWERALVERARQGVEVPGVPGLCMQTFGGGVELWDRSKDALVARASLPAVTQVAACPAGCLLLAAGEVALLKKEGELEILARGASALSWDRQEVLAVEDRQVHALGLDGARRASWNVDVGVTAVRRVGDRLALGYRDGSIELRPSSRGEGTVQLGRAGSGEVVRLVEGPASTLVASFASGIVALWSLPSGELLDTWKLHGVARHVLVVGDVLYAATDLGDRVRADLGILTRERCGLLREVWGSAPVEWEDGHPVRRGPPRGHACSTPAALSGF